jgi:uncharacterized membrane protein
MIALMKILHVLAAVVLLGNLIMAPFWRKRMAISDGLQARANANRSVRVADFLFTLPGWVVVLVTGLIMAIQGGFFRSGDKWLHVSVFFFLVWLVAWHAGTMRARKAMIAQANEAVASGQAAEALTQHERQWARWSYVSALVAVLILILMVVQPF